MELGKKQMLTVVKVVDFGVYLGDDREKVLLPKKQVPAGIEPGDPIEVFLYKDSSEYLTSDSPYQKDDQVEGIVYEVSDNFGAFVAVDGKYSALVPKREAPKSLRPGMKIHARVTEVKPDGKLNLSVREKAFIQMDKDALLVLARLEEKGGVLPFNDKADAEVIRAEFDLSKNAFKRAVGHLYKERKIEIRKDSIVLK